MQILSGMNNTIVENIRKEDNGFYGKKRITKINHKNSTHVDFRWGDYIRFYNFYTADYQSHKQQGSI
jgi:hypothetical protein